MAKPKTAYQCTECGAHAVKWQGQCPDCDAWNTLVETAVVRPKPGGAAPAVAQASLADDVELRYPTGFGEFDRVLGGGVVPGSVVLLGGDPGVGKSTLLLQVASGLPAELVPLYATGEESLRQVGQRARRLGVANPAIRYLAATSLDDILDQARAANAQALVIDSIQTMTAMELASAAGSVSQLRECVGRLVAFAKQREVAVFLIGHVTKEGAIAGPRAVEHMVDTVLYFESDPASRYTIVRAVKNRFGASNEMGFFAMLEHGFREVRNPSAIFLPHGQLNRAGSVVSCVWEGSRPLLAEIQALVADGTGQHAKRLAQGIDPNRLALLVAVLQRHCGVVFGAEDVFVNVAGGLRIAETSADLAVALALTSSFRNRPCRKGLVSFGETGLAGEVRPVRFGNERIAEAAKQGFDIALVPAANVPRSPVAGIDVVGVQTLGEALDRAFD